MGINIIFHIEWRILLNLVGSGENGKEKKIKFRVFLSEDENNMVSETQMEACDICSEWSTIIAG